MELEHIREKGLVKKAKDLQKENNRACESDSASRTRARPYVKNTDVLSGTR